MATGPARDTDSSAPTARTVREIDRFDRLVAESDRVLVDFYADWCGPCRLVESTVDELADESGADVVKVDVEAHPQLSARYDVKKIPTFLAFENGSVVERFVGMQNKETLLEAIE